MLALEDAQHQILQSISPLPAESVPLLEADGRVLAQDIPAPIDLPSFDNSAMDGYAVRSDDLKGVGAGTTVTLKLSSRLPAGQSSSEWVASGECVRIFTGSMLPPGADAVVMQEDTEVNPEQPKRIKMLDAVKPWENVRLRGEDVKEGTMLFHRGDRLQPGGLALLGSLGISAVSAGQRPRVGVMATGSELVEPGEPLSPGKIYESNRTALHAILSNAGAAITLHPLVPDTLDETRRALAGALEECDVLVTSGGVSVGELDCVKAAFESLGGTMEFWKVSIRPGKPFVYGRWRDRFWFGLPGNPVSAIVTFLLLVRPAVLRLQGATNVHLPSVAGILGEPLSNRGDRRHFVRVRIDEGGGVHATGVQASHMLKSLAAANGLVDVPPRAELAAGAPVKVLLLD